MRIHVERTPIPEVAVVTPEVFQDDRGFFTEVGPAFGKALPDSCGECMACVEACPVGALDRRYKP